jgi:unsaturated rhamnogalacturonyl hydrolase
MVTAIVAGPGNCAKLAHMVFFLWLVSMASAADRAAVGLSANQQVIEAELPAPAATGLPRVLLIGGLDGDEATAKLIRQQVARYEREGRWKKRYELAAIPLANPVKSKLVFPPIGDAYRDHTESHALWRWTATYAPDLVLVVGADDAGLAPALSREIVAGAGRIPACRVEPSAKLLADLRDLPAKSEARLEIEKRRTRSPREVAEEFARVYGHQLTEPVYIQSVALIGRLRLGALADVERIAAPYTDGTKQSLEKATSSHLSGHLLFAELAERTNNPAYVKLVRAAADMGFSASGEMLESMPMHSRMSDSVFMGCPILVKAGNLTGERKYYDMAARHFRFMQKLDQRADGLWRHSPLDEAAWGRGNAFAALGMALSLSDLPKDHPGYEEMLIAFRSLAAALARQQDETGMWRQVVDMPGSYREMSSTCMIAASLLRGVRRGWLDAKTYRPRIDKAWEAVKTRAGSDGGLIDVCESTGAQKSRDDYLRRKALLGRDPRGGAMVLLFSTEMAGLQ